MSGKRSLLEYRNLKMVSIIVSVALYPSNDVPSAIRSPQIKFSLIIPVISEKKHVTRPVIYYNVIASSSV
jgi:hypothetical protein